MRADKAYCLNEDRVDTGAFGDALEKLDKYRSTVQWTKLAQDSDVYHGSTFAEFSSSLIRFSFIAGRSSFLPLLPR